MYSYLHIEDRIGRTVLSLFNYHKINFWFYKALWYMALKWQFYRRTLDYKVESIPYKTNSGKQLNLVNWRIFTRLANLNLINIFSILFHSWSHQKHIFNKLPNIRSANIYFYMVSYVIGQNFLGKCFPLAQFPDRQRYSSDTSIILHFIHLAVHL